MLCVIPARGGSRRIPRKNIKDFFGKPIIAYSIETAFKSMLFKDVFVSTEDNEIAEIAIKYGAKVHERPEKYSHNYVGTQDVVRDFLVANPSDYVCCIYATAPLLSYKTLRVAATTFLASKENPAHLIAQYKSNGEDVDPGQFYFSRKRAIMDCFPYKNKKGRTYKFYIDEETACDINNMDDWIRAEEKYKILVNEGKL